MQTKIWHSLLCSLGIWFFFLNPTTSNGLTFSDPLSFDSLKKITAIGFTDWKFKNGDDLQYAQPKFDDSNWINITPLSSEELEKKLDFSSIIWFRTKIAIDSSLTDVPLFLIMDHFGASQIFIDGKLIKSFGNPATSGEKEIVINPHRIPISVSFRNQGEHLICVRYSNHQAKFNKLLFDFTDLGFDLYLGLNNMRFTDSLGSQSIYSTGFLAIFGFLLALSVLHLLIYFFYKEQRSNLTYSLFTGCFSLFILLFELSSHSSSPMVMIASDYFKWRFGVLTFFLLVQLVYSIVYPVTPKNLHRYTLLIGIIILSVLFFIPSINKKIFSGLIVLSITTACTITGILITGAMRKKMEGVRMIGRGFLTFTYIAAIYYILSNFTAISFSPDSLSGSLLFCFLAIGTLSIPFTMSMYLASNFAKTNKFLKLKLKQVENLSAITLEQERERKRLVESQKEDLEIQVKIRTAEVVAQKEELGTKNKEIIDSITYAKRLQKAILPPFELIKQFVPENFILYTPKDIIAGDFYWFHYTDEVIYVAAADSTGHGVPGAMVSIVCSNSLDKAVKEFDLKLTGDILDKTTELVLETFSKSGEDIKDGMDISLLCIHKKKKKVFWSGANNPLWYISNGEMKEIKADKQPVGKSDCRQPFQTHEIDLNTGDQFYLFTDGFPDQFGGPNGKKFKYGKLNQLLLSISNQPLPEQKEILLKTFSDWKGELEQVDDVCIIGIRL